MLQAGKIVVAPGGPGWVVETNGIVEPVAFLSGGRAEAYARLVCAIWAQAGHHTYLIVEDSSGRVIGRRFFNATGGEAA
jgi:hypothetical protein